MDEEEYNFLTEGTDTEYYTLTEVAEIIESTVDELLQVIVSVDVWIGIKTESDWYFWDHEALLLNSPIQGVRVVSLDEYSELDSIIKNGFATINYVQEGYLSKNQKLPNLGVIVKKEHLVIDKAGMMDICEPPTQKAFIELDNSDNFPVEKLKISPISQTERNTMLKLILGMSMDAYGYNPKATKNKATGENYGSIKAALDRLGISVDADTIRKYLNEAKDLLPPPAQ